MIRSAPLLLLQFLIAFAAAAVETVPLPPGSSAFFPTRVGGAVVADGGGIWASVGGGIAHYTATGSGAVLPLAGGNPGRLARAADGSIWFTNPTGIGRVSTSGTTLEQYTVALPWDIAVATDGALWYTSLDDTSVVGRIEGGARTEFAVPEDAWSIASAGDGAVWILPTGLGASLNHVYRMTPGGDVTSHAIGADVLFGQLQTVGDGTLYLGTGLRDGGLLRLTPGSTNFTAVPGFKDHRFLVDDAHNIWSATDSALNYLAANGTTRFSVQLPYDPRQACDNDYWLYTPLVIDSDGGLWLNASIDGIGFPFPMPCSEPAPKIARLIRLDIAALLAPNAAHDVPALSTVMLVSLAALVLAIGASRLRGE